MVRPSYVAITTTNPMRYTNKWDEVEVISDCSRNQTKVFWARPTAGQKQLAPCYLIVQGPEGSKNPPSWVNAMIRTRTLRWRWPFICHVPKPKWVNVNGKGAIAMLKLRKGKTLGDMIRHFSGRGLPHHMLEQLKEVMEMIRVMHTDFGYCIGSISPESFIYSSDGRFYLWDFRYCTLIVENKIVSVPDNVQFESPLGNLGTPQQRDEQMMGIILGYARDGYLPWDKWHDTDDTLIRQKNEYIQHGFSDWEGRLGTTIKMSNIVKSLIWLYIWLIVGIYLYACGIDGIRYLF
jgi:hypothetical protein